MTFLVEFDLRDAVAVRSKDTGQRSRTTGGQCNLKLSPVIPIARNKLHHSIMISDNLSAYTPTHYAAKLSLKYEH